MEGGPGQAAAGDAFLPAQPDHPQASPGAWLGCGLWLGSPLSCVCCFQPLGTSKSARRPGASSRPRTSSHSALLSAFPEGDVAWRRPHPQVPPHGDGWLHNPTDPPQGIVCVPVKLTIPAEGSDRHVCSAPVGASPGPRLCSLQLGPGGVGGTRKPREGQGQGRVWSLANPALASGVPQSPRTSAAAFSGMNGRRLAPCVASC